MSPRQLVPAGVVLLAIALIAGIAQLARPAPAGPGPAGVSARREAVTSAVRACPPVQGGGQGQVAFIGAAAEPSSGPASGSGQAELVPLPLAGASLRAARPISQADAGALQMLTVPAAQSESKKDAPVLQGWSVTASGTMAQAMEAEEADGSGLATVRCGEPGSDIWFVGPGQLNGAAQIQLDLMNVDALAASVDVSVITEAGPAQAGDDSGITVPPHETVTESLSSAATGSSVVAIEVRTSIGRVAADVSESSHGGTTSWLPSTTAPSTRLVIPGVPPSGRAAGLYIAVPGSSNAQVSMLALTSQGAFHPSGTQTIDLPGDSASYVALTPLGGTASALELAANVPVTAAVLVPGSGLGAFTEATAPISEQAVVAGNTGPGATIVLSAPAAAARVRLTEIAVTPDAGTGAAGTGATGSQVVSVRAGHTLAVPASAPPGARRGSAFAIVITPLAGSGPLYAARVQTQGQGTVVSIIPAVSAPATISLPAVRNSYDAISP
jgi:hypothetical protein